MHFEIVVASNNPVKITSAKQGFEQMFPGTDILVRGVSVSSGVSHQPMTDEETLQGAKTRAVNARTIEPGADFWVGIEGGVAEDEHGMSAFAWVVILGRHLSGQSRTGAFYLPTEVSTLVREGVELGEADDMVFGRVNSKQGNGAVGLLTNDLIDREAYYEHAVILALVPFINPGLYQLP